MKTRIQQEHRGTKRRLRPMLGFKSFASDGAILKGIEIVIHIMYKGQVRYAFEPNPSLAEQFVILAA
ncbi:hypothetical protein [Mesorhizobium sp.]|uniref:hypothetical protein n=1 Tax=Mesorhizobium sp. TaxID=1871066 RepID=UPI000FE89ADC|nr:MAG: IS6 family transposase [Mesorhizobium sp.]RWO45215.1 MAG: IS6 family transposase [Mesorhizobium sp.]TIN25115.1 MAG: IS6 family transposase [Mesorhizobium sp.]TIO49088.1 MAG: IS6 family transposase [Mesorhizobium sp.]TIO57181.1 MAG: IS6 family transposase [Mesorhizobium sp.]